MHVLFVWELGGNYGHLMRILPFAERLRSFGCLISFLVADTHIAEEVLLPRGFAFEKTFTRYHQTEQKAPSCFADLLRWAGFNTAQMLLRSVDEYVAYFRDNEIGVVVGDYSPCAAVAAKAAGISYFAVGNGFEIPPQTHPLPSIRPWDNVSESDIKISCNQVLSVINEVLGGYKKQPIDSVSGIFDIERSFIASYPELDHYGQRPVGKYIGLTNVQASSDAGLPKNFSPSIFAYVSNASISNDSIVEALGREHAKTLLVCRGYNNKKEMPSNIFHSHHPVDFAKFIYGVSIMVTNANAGTVISGLLHGIPQVLIPRTIEQTLFACRVVEMGAGIMLRGVVIPSDVTSAIRILTSNGTYRDAAREFAGRYANKNVLDIGYIPGIIGNICQQIISAGLKTKIRKD